MGKYRTRKEGKLTPEYRAWKNMKARCYSKCNVNMGKYQEYEIKVCDRWLHSYDNFREDMGLRPDSTYSLDRINCQGYYSPENCRWASKRTQASNRGSFNRVFTYRGETKILKDWARYFGIKYTTLYTRMHRGGLTFDDAIKI